VAERNIVLVRKRWYVKWGKPLSASTAQSDSRPTVLASQLLTGLLTN